MSFFNFGRLHVIKRLEFADVFLPACVAISHEFILLTRLNLSVAHLEALHSLVHLHITVVDWPVSYLWLGWASSAAIHGGFRVFFLPTDVFNCRVKVLPERFDSGHILSFAHFLVPFACLIHVVIDVSRELLLVQVVDQSVCILTLVSLVSWAHVQGWLFVWPVSSAAILTLRLNAIMRVRVLSTATNRAVFVNSTESFRPLFQPAVSRWYLDGVSARNTDRSVAVTPLNRWK